MSELDRRPTSASGVAALLLLPFFCLGVPATGQERTSPARAVRHPVPDRPVRQPVRQPGAQAKPGGSGSFFLDPHRRGLGVELRLTAVSWGRLVDVHGLRADGSVDPRPAFPGFVIGEDVQTDGVDYVLDRNPVTQVERLIVLRPRSEPEFVELVRVAAGEVDSVRPKADDGTASLPFSLVKRNAALVLQFDDLLDDSAAAVSELAQNVRVFVGYPPTAPFQARLFFDPNFGGVANGSFHSSRVVIDLTVSELEAAESGTPLPLNALGLPASLVPRRNPNVSVRLPTRVDPGSGQLSVLTSLGGAPLSTTTNGPVDPGSPTLDVVRAARSGNDRDPDEGFLTDETPPRLLGAFALTVTDADGLPNGEPGFDFVVNLAFEDACRFRPLVGDVIHVGGRFLEVVVEGMAPDSAGVVSNVIVRLAGSVAAQPTELEGVGLFLTPFRSRRPVDPACWFGFLPPPGAPPGDSVSTAAQVQVRFSEPLDPTSVRPFDTLRILRGSSGAPASPSGIVVADVRLAANLREFVLTPLLPLAHVQGTATPYHVELGEVCDLAGNALADGSLVAGFSVDPAEPTQANGGVVLRFASGDELEPLGAPDLRGQFFYDVERERVRPRDLLRSSHVADRTVPLGALMFPFPPSTQAPLSPLGAKLHSVWRYADFGWQVQDETKFNLDVEGLAWVPPDGLVVADFFEEFEIRLAHSSRLPDEDIDINLLPKYPQSGLRGAAGEPFSDNVLDDPDAPQTIVHPRSLGYAVDPGDLFAAASGTVMMPYPMNRHAGPRRTYTWRDTGAVSRAGEDGAGIPLDVEVGPPLFLEPEPGVVAPAGAVPTLGLPLLIEIRTYPTDTGIGLNRFDVSLAINSSANPAFRAFSVGGVDTSGNVITKDPDLEVVPSGGFNPASVPPGQPSRPVDNLVYLGQIDTVTRISRVHSIWIDAGVEAPDYFAPRIEASTPGASSVVVEYRGANGFSADAGPAPFDAQRIDPYGDPDQGSVDSFAGMEGWTDDIDDLDGARFLQLRFTFVGDLDERRIATLEGIGIAFAE